MIPLIRLEVGYGSTWRTEDAAVTWTDETARVLDRDPIGTFRGATSAFGKPDAGTLSLTLKNRDRRFDPEHTGSPLDGDLVPGVPVRLLASDILTDPDGDVLQDPKWQVLVGPGGKAVWRGFVKSWPQSHDAHHSLVVPLQGYDAFSRLSRLRLPGSVLEYEILKDSPLSYWPLDETAGETMQDQSGNGHDGTYTPGSTDLAAVRSRTPGLVWDGEHAGRVTDATSVVIEAPLVYTAVVSPDKPGGDGNLLTCGDGSKENFGQLQIESNVDDTQWDARGVADLGHSDNIGWGADSNYNEGEIHHIAYRLPSGSAALVYTDGVEETQNFSAATSKAAQAPGAVVAGSKLLGNTGVLVDRPYSGFAAHVAIFDTDIGATRIAAHAEAALAPWDGDRTDERIGRILDVIDWPADLRDLEEGKSLLGPAWLGAANALEYLRRIAASEDGKLFIDAAGKIRLLDRHWPWTATASTTSQVTVTDDSSGDASYRRLIRDSDDELIINSATVSTVDDEVTIVDEDSIDDFGEAAETIDTVLTSTAVARSLAQWTIATRSRPRTRLPSIRVPLHKYSVEAQDKLLDLDLGHRVTVKHQPHGVGASVDLDFAVAGIRNQIRFGVWWMELYLEPAPNNDITLFTLGTSQLGGTHVLGH